MTWKKYFRPVNSVLPVAQRAVDSTSSYTSTAKYSNWLPEVYAGPPDRLQRYLVYDAMNYDHEISAALDTITDFATDPDEITKLPLVIEYNDEPTPSEIQILEKSLGQWVRMNKLSRRLWRMFRSVLVYGDQFFIRDPETFELYWIDPAKVEKVIVNESNGKKIESYFIKDIDLNMKNLVATNQLNKASNAAFGSNSIVFSPPMAGNMNYISGGFGSAGSANYQDGGATTVDAEHIVQLSLTDGMNSAWPFGLSILEQIFKVYKQKELLEDAILIYRIHRAPERRVFFIDVGTMPPNKASQYLERIRYEVQQKRIPSRTGGGTNVVDSTYNPMCFDMSTRIPLLDGRTLSITELAEEYEIGKENWVYSCDPITGKVVPGNITWAGVTKKHAQVLKITLDDGKTITCTPEHKIPVLGKGFVEAKDLTINDPLISFNTRNNDGYMQVYNHDENKWEFVHSLVGNFFKNLQKHQVLIFDKRHEDSEKTTLRHKDYNISNNSPKNIVWMNHDDADVLAKFVNPDEWKNLSKETEYAKLKELHIAVKNYQASSAVSTTRFVDKFAGILGEMMPKYISIITCLDNAMDVGTITVDGNERWQNYHTFALESGIFVKNSMLEDYYFAVGADGRGSKVEVLPGGENLGDIDDLRYFNNKMLRALGVPSSYLPTGPEDGTAAPSDGKVGTAFIQEFRFSKVVTRYQQQIIEPLDDEFKLFIKHRGITIDNSLFNLKFTPAQSFSEYRQLELDSARINTFTALMDVPYISKRFVLKTYLAWTEEQMAENERMWKEERSRLTKTFAPEQGGGGSPTSGLSDVGITSSGIDGMAPEGGDIDDTGGEAPDGGVSDTEVDNFGGQ